MPRVADDGVSRRLKDLTRRWRERHETRRAAVAERPQADEERESRARRHFPYREMTPAAYAAGHGEAMTGYTYDAYRYLDPELEAWLMELGRILREQRRRR